MEMMVRVEEEEMVEVLGLGVVQGQGVVQEEEEAAEWEEEEVVVEDQEKKEEQDMVVVVEMVQEEEGEEEEDQGAVQVVALGLVAQLGHHPQQRRTRAGCTQ